MLNIKERLTIMYKLIDEYNCNREDLINLSDVELIDWLCYEEYEEEHFKEDNLVMQKLKEEDEIKVIYFDDCEEPIFHYDTYNY